jgi:hypothetical protein
MRIDLAQSITAAEELLAGLRELDGTEIDGDTKGRAARDQRTETSMSLQLLAHKADTIRVALTGTHLGLRDRARGRDGTATGQDARERA